MFCVYLLRSVKDNGYYIGHTKNIEVRLGCHNSGRVKSTKNRIPLVLRGVEEYATRNEARWREYVLKSNTSERNKFIRKFDNLVGG